MSDMLPHTETMSIFTKVVVLSIRPVFSPFNLATGWPAGCRLIIAYHVARRLYTGFQCLIFQVLFFNSYKFELELNIQYMIILFSQRTCPQSFKKL